MVERHGYRGTPTYSSWMCMRIRCNNPSAKDYHRYGGRGVKVCGEWNKSFVSFLKDMGERPEGKTLDRIDPEGNYCKENCRWATSKEQGRNTRFNRMIEYNGETRCLAEWAEIFNINRGTLSKRIDMGWSIENALNTKLNESRKGVPHNQRFIEYNGESKNIKEWAKFLGMDHTTLHKRLTTYGMSVDEAFTRPVGKNSRKNKNS